MHEKIFPSFGVMVSSRTNKPGGVEPSRAEPSACACASFSRTHQQLSGAARFSLMCVFVNRWGTHTLFEAQLCEDAHVFRFSSCLNTCVLCLCSNNCVYALIVHHNKTAYKARKRRKKHFTEKIKLSQLILQSGYLVWFVCPEGLMIFRICWTALYLCLPLINSARLRPLVIMHFI